MFLSSIVFVEANKEYMLSDDHLKAAGDTQKKSENQEQLRRKAYARGQPLKLAKPLYN